MPNYLIALIPIALIALWVGAAVVDARQVRLRRTLYLLRDKLPGAATWAVLLFALFCGVLALFFGRLGYSEETKEEFYVNLSTSLGSIAITVLVIDQLNRWRIASERKREIIEQMGSPVNDAALEAVRLAMKNGWHTDGSLKGAYLSSANLKGLVLDMYPDLEGAILVSANLEGARIAHANLQNVHLSDANLEGARLNFSNLQGAQMLLANLKNALLAVTNLEGANLTEANLEGANLTEANLEGACLSAATLHGADLTGANLTGANLTDPILETEYLRVLVPPEHIRLYPDLWRAEYNSKTIWPDGFDPVAAGARLVDADPGQTNAESPA